MPLLITSGSILALAAYSAAEIPAGPAPIMTIFSKRLTCFPVLLYNNTHLNTLPLTWQDPAESYSAGSKTILFKNIVNLSHFPSKGFILQADIYRSVLLPVLSPAPGGHGFSVSWQWLLRECPYPPASCHGK